MAGIEKLAANGIQAASSAIQKSGSIIQSAAKTIEAGSEKLISALSGLAANNSALVKKTSVLHQSAAVKPVIKPIETDKEYIEIMKKLMDDPRYIWKAESGDIFDKGIKPWGDTCDIHAYINGYITKGSIPTEYILPDKPNDTFMDDIVRCFKYALKKEDEKFGQFKGFVFRHGFFGNQNSPEIITERFYSASSSPKILFMKEHKDCNAILAGNGHKIYKTQERLGDRWHANHEREVLLNPNERYRRIEHPSQELINMAKQTLDIPANYENSLPKTSLIGELLTDKGISEQAFWKDYLESILDKLIFWEKAC